MLILKLNCIMFCPADNCLAIWIPELRTHWKAPILLVGTKADLREDMYSPDNLRKGVAQGDDDITYGEGNTMSRKIKAVGYMECSAMTLEGVNRVFDEAFRQALKIKKKTGKSSGSGLICTVL